MLIIPNFVGPSKIPGAGMGLFTKNKIALGTVVWKRHPLSFFTVSRHDAAMLPETVYGFLRTYATLRDAGWELAWDNGRFMNHSDQPNLVFDQSGNLIAIRAIAAGEELTEDYRTLAEIESLPEGIPEAWIKP